MLNVDSLVRMSEKATRSRVDVEQLRLRIWLKFILESRAIDIAALAVLAVDKRLASKASVYKWHSGAASPHPSSLDRMEKLVPGSRDLYTTCLWTFLTPAPIAACEIKRLLVQYWGDGKNGPWQFPNDAALKARGVSITYYGRNDTTSLASRGDVFGTAVLAGLVREAEAMDEPQLHIYRTIDLVRSLPSFLATSPIAEHYEDLKMLLEHVIGRSAMTSGQLRVYWEQILKLAKDPRVEHPINWRVHTGSTLDPIRYTPYTLPPPSPWAEWLRTQHRECDTAESSS